jgi:hypothetical protein
MKTKQPAIQRPWWRKPTTWLIALALPAVAFLGLFAVREWDASNELQVRLQKLRSTGRPIDNASLDVKYVSSTNSEQSVAWNEAAYAASGWASTMGQDLPFLGNKNGVPPAAFSKGEWPEVERVDEFLTQLQPVLKRLHETADKTTQPVWQPIHFDGYNTLLGSIQESRSIVRLLTLDFCYAVYSKDRQRALRDLKSIRAAIVAYSWDVCLVQELVRMAHVGTMNHVVGMSLSTELWTSEDLAEIGRLVGGPKDMAQHWQRILDNEQAFASDTSPGVALLHDPTGKKWMGFALSLPSVQLRYLDDMERIKSVGQNDLMGLLRAAEQLERDWNFGVAASLFAPSVGAVARAYVNSEESRRLVKTGLALKQFRLSHGKFPVSLEQLPSETALNITRADITGVDQLLFGYEIEGAEAHAWNLRPIVAGWANFTQNRPQSYNPDGWGAPQGHSGTVINIK